MNILAIDIGKTGALALLSPAGDLIDIADMPTLYGDGPADRPGINAALLAGIVRRWNPTSAIAEYVSARPKEAPSGAFSFGRSKGVIEGVLGSQAVPVRFVTPAWWKRRVGIPPGAGMKDLARSKAIAHWPAHADLFARVMDHDRAEAALIGLASLKERKAV
ncbi:hypothetical protein [Lichenihabitans psoromatis]|uniref:hypothetical protein n=1 Tax=Lichenihabitans psoromatis TaxID=2528642 RepID=UPI0010361EBA|nr:hypothetical protein [Lichenihabitans psoromatis]